MPDLDSQLARDLPGRIRWLGLGADDRGDDAAGLRLAAGLAARGVPHVVLAGTQPERWLAAASLAGFDHVVVLDAVAVGAAPGSVVFLPGAELASRLPQVSTHRLSLGLLARWVEAETACTVWLLGVQPESLRLGAGLSPAVQSTLDLLIALLAARFGRAGTPRAPGTLPVPC
jgi:hydrogenase maturation protease